MQSLFAHNKVENGYGKVHGDGWRRRANHRMETAKYFHMSGGEGENSYAANCSSQKNAMLKAKYVVKEAVKEICNNGRFDKINVADLGCSSGPTTIMLINDILDSISNSFKGRQLPDVHFFLNDLPMNDFNTMFRLVDSYRSMTKVNMNTAPFYVSGVPGSFYGRILPKNSINFVHSSYGIHWLSQVPLIPDVDSFGALISKRDVGLTSTSPSIIVKSYMDQFRKDFTQFLKCRDQELISGGKMVLVCVAREGADPTTGESCCIWESLGEALNDMVSECLITEKELEKINFPSYTPCLEEVSRIVQEEGSFSLERVHTFRLCRDPSINYDVHDKDTPFDRIKFGRNATKALRPALEPTLRQHLGEIDMDELFMRYSEKFTTIPLEKCFNYNIVVQLKKVRY